MGSTCIVCCLVRHTPEGEDRRGNTATEAAVGALWPQCPEPLDAGRKEGVLPRALGGTVGLLTLSIGFWPTELYCIGTHFCCFKPPSVVICYNLRNLIQ